jgi:hypothetical protein
MNAKFARLARCLLILNLLLQLFDGVMSYRVLSAGVGESNPLIHTTIVNWGVIQGLFYHKILACVLLILIFVVGRRRELLATQALAITASVYTCFGLVCLWALLS